MIKYKAPDIIIYLFYFVLDNATSITNYMLKAQQHFMRVYYKDDLLCFYNPHIHVLKG